MGTCLPPISPLHSDPQWPDVARHSDAGTDVSVLENACVFGVFFVYLLFFFLIFSSSVQEEVMPILRSRGVEGKFPVSPFLVLRFRFAC